MSKPGMGLNRRGAKGGGMPELTGRFDRHCPYCPWVIKNAVLLKPLRCPSVECRQAHPYMDGNVNRGTRDLRRCPACLDLGLLAWRFCWLCGHEVTDAERQDHRAKNPILTEVELEAKSKKQEEEDEKARKRRKEFEDLAEKNI